MISALVVNKKAQRSSQGLKKGFGVKDDEAERQKLYRYWGRLPHKPTADWQTEDDSSLPVRALRFARTAVRPDQIAFRRAVFLAYKGRCAVTGCAIKDALDAAHLSGRDWRRGHNAASDGVLLRKDLHALYDAGLITVVPGGRVTAAPEVRQEYKGLDGRRVARPA